MATKKGKLGVPDLWDEVKKNTSLTLTPTAVKGLDELAKEFGLSRSELVERIGRRLFEVEPKDVTPPAGDEEAAVPQ